MLHQTAARARAAPAFAAFVHFLTRAPGSRHGKDVAILNVDAQRMRAEGLQFYRSENGVWLTASVPPQYVSLRKA